MRRPTRYLALLILAWTGAAGQDLYPLDHGLAYEGTDGIRPVRVEITLRQQRDGTLEYAEWVMPTGWARWLTRSRVRRAMLAYADETLRPRSLDTGGEAAAPPADLPPGALDELSVRLRARADIARGLRTATYPVWRADGTIEQWTLELGAAETVSTPDGNYQALRFRLGTGQEWLEGWSAPLLVFHFVRLEFWRDGERIGELALVAKEL